VNRGLIGFPTRPSRSARFDRMLAADAMVGTPVSRTAGYSAPLESDGVALQVGAIKATASLWAIAYCPVDDRMYAVANTADGQVVVANTATQRVERRFHVGANPIAIAYAPTISRLLILRTDGTVVVYDPRRRVVERKVASGVAAATAIVFVPTSGKAYVIGSASAAVSLSLSAWTTSAIAIPVNAQSATFSRTEDRVYLACGGGIAAIEVPGESSAGVVHASSQPLDHIAYSPIAGKVYGFRRSTVNPIALVVTLAPLGANEEALLFGAGASCFSPPTRRVYAGYNAGVQAWDNPVAEVLLVDSVLSCGLARGMAYCPSDHRVYAVSDAGAPEIAVIV
jgi:hypothetical protein